MMRTSKFTQLLPRNFQKEFYQIIEKNNIENITKFIEPYKPTLIQIISDSEQNIVNPSIKQGLITLMLRYGILIKDDIIIDLIKDNSKMIRDFLDIIAYKKLKEFNIDLFINKINIDILTPKNISFMIDNNLFYLFNLLDGKFIYGEKKSYSSFINISILKKYKLINSLYYIDNISKNIFDKKKLETFLNLLNSIEYDIILDAGNILYYNKGVKTPIYLKNMIDYLISNNLRPLIIIHQGHKKDCNEIIKDKLHFYTPKDHNDDLFILLAYLKKSCSIITNDQYGDHIDLYKNKEINNSNYLGGYLLDDLQNYTISNNTIILKQINNYSRCIQIIDKHIYIPTEQGFIDIIDDN